MPNYSEWVSQFSSRGCIGGPGGPSPSSGGGLQRQRQRQHDKVALAAAPGPPAPRMRSASSESSPSSSSSSATRSTRTAATTMSKSMPHQHLSRLTATTSRAKSNIDISTIDHDDDEDDYEDDDDDDDDRNDGATESNYQHHVSSPSHLPRTSDRRKQQLSRNRRRPSVPPQPSPSHSPSTSSFRERDKFYSRPELPPLDRDTGVSSASAYSQSSSRDVDVEGGGDIHSTRLNKLVERRRQLAETRRRREQLIADTRSRRLQEQKQKQQRQKQRRQYGGVTDSSQPTSNYIVTRGGSSSVARQSRRELEDHDLHDGHRYQHQYHHHYPRHQQKQKTNDNNKKKMYYSCDNCHQTFENYDEAERHERVCKRGSTERQQQNKEVYGTNVMKHRNYEWKVEEEETYYDDDFDSFHDCDVIEEEEDDEERDDGSDKMDGRPSSQSQQRVASTSQGLPRTTPSDGNYEWTGHNTGIPTKRWICEVCEQAKFDDYTMAVKHEVQCRRQLYLKQQQHEQENFSLRSHHDESEAEGTNNTWRTGIDGSYSDEDDESSSPASYHGPDDDIFTETNENDDDNNSIVEGDFEPIADHKQRTDQMRKQLVSTIIEKTRQLYVDENSGATGRRENNMNVSQIIASTIRGTTNTWLCAVCRMRTFDSYQKACEHEKECSMTAGQSLRSQEQNQEQELVDEFSRNSKLADQQNRVLRSFRHQIQF